MVVLQRAGLTHHGVLGSGVEGTVADLGDGTVAKVWAGRGLTDLDLLRGFYDAVNAARPTNLAVAMPHILELTEVDGTVITIERRLTGDPVWRADGTSPTLTVSHIDSMTEALAALAAVPGEPTLRALPMLPNEPRLAPNAPFETELATLVTRRAARYVTALRAAHPDVDAIVTATDAALRGLPPAGTSLVHGDLIAANVLASGGHATAVLDFGFLSTAGDPAFDAAIAASCFDMWGPNAPGVEGELDRAFLSAFGHDHHRYSVYRAAYALTTACCFGTDLSDGHFAWCMAMLNRADVRDALPS
jgi:aminoglycoside phosphotransferase (APT) family kinase protein